MFYQLIFLILVNLLFGIAPLFVGNLAGKSTFTLSFYRFFGAAVLESGIILILYFVLYFRLKKKGYMESFPRFLFSNLKNYYGGRNRLFRNQSQWVYLLFLGVLLTNLSVPMYFLSFTVNGLVISTIFVNAATLILIAIYNWMKGKEKFDLLKIIDMILLIAAIITIAYSYSEHGTQALSTEGFIIIITVIISYTTFLILVGRDTSSKSQILKESSSKYMSFITSDKKSDQLSTILTALLKLVGIHGMGGVLIIPFCWITARLGPGSLIGQLASDFIYSDLPQFWDLLLTPSIIALIIVASVIPYFLLNLSVATWPKHALSHDLWNSIFTLLDPLVGMYIGFWVWKEPIKPDYIIFTTLFLITGIVIRYFHGSMNTKGFLFVVKLKPNQSTNFLRYIEKVKEIDQINRVIGTYDFILHITVQSMETLAKIANKINYFSGLERAYYSIEDPCL